MQCNCCKKNIDEKDAFYITQEDILKGYPVILDIGFCYKCFSIIADQKIEVIENVL